MGHRVAIGLTALLALTGCAGGERDCSNGADDDALATALETTVAGKWAGHGITHVDFIRPARSMSEIGG